MFTVSGLTLCRYYSFGRGRVFVERWWLQFFPQRLFKDWIASRLASLRNSSRCESRVFPKYQIPHPRSDFRLGRLFSALCLGWWGDCFVLEKSSMLLRPPVSNHTLSGCSYIYIFSDLRWVFYPQLVDIDLFWSQDNCSQMQRTAHWGNRAAVMSVFTRSAWKKRMIQTVVTFICLKSIVTGDWEVSPSTSCRRNQQNLFTYV